MAKKSKVFRGTLIVHENTEENFLFFMVLKGAGAEMMIGAMEHSGDKFEERLLRGLRKDDRVDVTVRLAVKKLRRKR